MASIAARMCAFAKPGPLWALAVVAVLEIGLFAGHHAERWHKSLARRSDPRVAAGTGLVIQCDGHGYYAWLRSLLIDGDLSFDNEFDEHNPLHDWVPGKRTERGLRANPWSVGPACIWSLTVVPAHLALAALEDPDPAWKPDGYSFPYQILVGLTTVVGSIVGLGFLYGICRHFARPGRAALAAAFLTLGSTIVFYSAIEVSMAHGVATAALAALVWYWLRTYGSVSPGRWFLVGVLVGLAALMRWQLVMYALLPAGECFLKMCRGTSRQECGGWKRITLLCLAALGAWLSFVPQIVAWKAVYGHWLVAPEKTAHNWGCPSLWQVLGSHDRGLFYWTPITLLALAGFFVGRRSFREIRESCPGKGEPMRLLLAAFAIQVYAIASMIGEEMYLGVSFGMRILTESVVVLGPGLALLLERAPRRWFQILCALACGLVLWNLLLIEEYRHGWIPAAAGADPVTLVAKAARLIHRKKLWLVGPVLAGPLLLWLLSRQRGFAEAEPAAEAVP